MILPEYHSCASCGHPAQRFFNDEDGSLLPLCNRCPSPSEIELLTAKFRESWSQPEYWPGLHDKLRKAERERGRS